MPNKLGHLAVNTQTPLVRLRGDVAGVSRDGVLPLDRLRRGEQYRFTAGGVTRMLLPLLERWVDEGVARDPEWFSMAAAPSPALAHRGVILRFIEVPEVVRRRYARAKESLWQVLNGLPEAPPDPAVFAGPRANDWEGFVAYNGASAAAIARRGREDPFGLHYVNDFQQMLVGGALDDAPSVFHLHTPFTEEIPETWRRFFAGHLSPYASVVVSTDRYARVLAASGYAGRIARVYPFLDPAGYPEPSPKEVEEFSARFGIAPSDRVLLAVARMDPMKGQDRLVKAMPAILAREPRARLVLVGNGSFSSSTKGGLGLSKGQKWRAHLEALADALGVRSRVTFTGHVATRDIPAAYGRADVAALPSLREGFGLAVVEAWLYGKPVVVSAGAGIAELVRDGSNGFVVDPANADALADVVCEIFADASLADALGRGGLATTSAVTVDEGSRALARALDRSREVVPRVS
ncbi:MAG TPA: glycosyltransferase family 4 protein [Candidatus Thermoplasmatota archaeon]|nr:glycosyltransferase family 4 protein [Candidatus Thermoplasmatota archaeon]